MKNSSNQELRILSFLPAATEIVYLLGLGNQLVGVSHECDYPPKAKLKPKVTFSPVTNDLSSKEINTKTRELLHRGAGVFHIDSEILKELKPNLILTQEICDVCAIPFNQVKQAARILEGDVIILSLEPESIEDIFENVLTVGKYTGTSLVARQLVASLQHRIHAIKKRISEKRVTRKRVLMIEWLDPVMVAGHWVPQMVKLAGGINLITKSGKKSYSIESKNILRENPDIIIFAPCGFDIKRTLKEKHLLENWKLRFGNSKNLHFFVMDGNSYLTRPGPRIIDGVEILAEILHPEIFPRKHNKTAWQNI